MQCTGTSADCFPQEKRAGIVQTATQLISPFFLCAMFSCFYITGCEAYTFTTDGYGIFNVRTDLGACHTHQGGVRHKRVCTRVIIIIVAYSYSNSHILKKAFTNLSQANAAHIYLGMWFGHAAHEPFCLHLIRNKIIIANTSTPCLNLCCTGTQH